MDAIRELRDAEVRSSESEAGGENASGIVLRDAHIRLPAGVFRVHRDQGPGRFPVRWPAKIVALRVLATENLQLGELLSSLHALRDYIDAKIVGQRHNGADDLQTIRVQANPADKGAVDLEGLNLQMLQLAQRGVTSAEIVDVQTDMQVPQARQQRGDVVRVLHHGAFGNLEAQSEAAAAWPTLPQDALDFVDRAQFRELHG